MSRGETHGRQNAFVPLPREKVRLTNRENDYGSLMPCLGQPGKSRLICGILHHKGRPALAAACKSG